MKPLWQACGCVVFCRKGRTQQKQFGAECCEMQCCTCCWPCDAPQPPSSSSGTQVLLLLLWLLCCVLLQDPSHDISNMDALVSVMCSVGAALVGRGEGQAGPTTSRTMSAVSRGNLLPEGLGDPLLKVGRWGAKLQ